jgi:hypothetical protein
MPRRPVLCAAMAERKLLDQVSDLARFRHLSRRTEETKSEADNAIYPVRDADIISTTAD